MPITQIRCRDPDYRTPAYFSIALLPASEAPLSEMAISRFRTGYVCARFRVKASVMTRWQASGAGRKAQGMEHWLPLFSLASLIPV